MGHTVKEDPIQWNYDFDHFTYRLGSASGESILYIDSIIDGENLDTIDGESLGYEDELITFKEVKWVEDENLLEFTSTKVEGEDTSKIDWVYDLKEESSEQVE
ncbi:hypothetical protein [Natranaerobius trueperi]|uniref:Uncharacterized protein n=1 Tax=Natranaerobius trueperi TaxID=759412 RepID=A0A226BVS0_9FIRM|nr:hypothetical protein [Natranaerobius trueperi]OWZ82991.1 hypothetical protein CDO51_10850 [Natranaerobius trueperi]